MKKNLQCAVALTLCVAAHPSFAQSSVTLYGVVDEGVQYLSGASSSGGKVVGLQSGNQWPSNFGITGKEDLGGGYSALFRLEEGIDVSTGKNVIPATPLNRAAYVGLQGPFGTVTMGRQYGVMFDQTLMYDPTYLAQFSLMSSNLIPSSIEQLNNSIKWLSPTYRGLSVEAMYGFGQQIAGNFRAGKYMGGALAYANGGLSARVLFEQTQGSSADGIDESGLKDQRMGVAMKYRLGDVTLEGGYHYVRGDLELSPPGSIFNLGAIYSATAQLNLVTEVIHYRTRNHEGTPLWFVLGSIYSLSKRTDLYAFAGYLDNRGGKSFTLNTYDFSSPGGLSQAGVQLGITHRF
ncbi:porin [Paraburkholderia sp.]|uniref:porin n=1 Tax=Paraburkholderia sp. TaxID=1926495 RepID=UPI0023930EB7|nr:porin [Paraburkholderia sp.]MDE1180514.1 porin [Paraburkholderia sp.]